MIFSPDANFMDHPLIEDKCYFFSKTNQKDEEAKAYCKTIFGPGIDGHMFEPMGLHILNTVDQAANDFGVRWYRVGVSSGDYKYFSNGKSASETLGSIPWNSGQPSRFSNAKCICAHKKKWSNDLTCSATNCHVICEMF